MEIDLSKLNITPAPWAGGFLEVGSSPMLIEKVCKICLTGDSKKDETNKDLIKAAPEMMKILIDALYEDSFDYVKSKELIERVLKMPLKDVFELTVKED